jgi:penicillin-insensitive murein endopeptidase
MMGEHILSLNTFAKLHGLKVKKIILMKSLKDNLYATPSGKMILKKKLYITMNLPPNVDKSHDNHYHIDFTVL